MLEREGFDERIDHRSLIDQGIDREPTTHIGPAGKEMEQRGNLSDRAQQNRDVQAINDELQRAEAELAKSQERLTELLRLKAIADHASRVWDDSERPPNQPLQPEQAPAYPPSQPSAPSGGKAGAMPDDISKQHDDADQKEADRIKKAIDDELARQENARREGDRLQNEFTAADKRLKELGQLWRQAQEHRERLIQQARELEEASIRYERQGIQEQGEKEARKNPVETYIKVQDEAVETRRQDRIYEQERRYLEGDIRNPHSRYVQTLHNNYDWGDPYQSLAKVAIAEHAAFRHEQDTLSTEIANTPDAKLAAALEVRRKIEGYEYLALTGERIAVQSELITGRTNSEEAVRMRGLVNGKDILDENGNKIGFEDGYNQKAQQLRKEYRDLQAERTAPQKEQAAQPEAKPERAYRPRTRRSGRDLDDLIKQQDEAQKAKEQAKLKTNEDERKRQEQKERERRERDRDRDR
jgi:hypothetical protein